MGYIIIIIIIINCLCKLSWLVRQKPPPQKKGYELGVVRYMLQYVVAIHGWL